MGLQTDVLTIFFFNMNKFIFETLFIQAILGLTKDMLHLPFVDLNTRITFWIKKIYLEAEEQFDFFQNNFIQNLFFIFFGFLFGTLFGSFLEIIRKFFIWDGFILCNLIIIFEIINFYNFRLKKHHKYWKYLNSYKIGILLGFFLDAFKVGS